jgi:hypothetical protein
MRQCTAQEQLFCIDGNRQIISQVYLLQVKSSLMRLRAVLIYQLTRNTILFVKVINQYLEILIYCLGCWLWKYILVLTNTNSTILLKGCGLFQLLSSYVSGGVLYPSFFTKSVWPAVGIGLYHQLGSGGGS